MVCIIKFKVTAICITIAGIKPCIRLTDTIEFTGEFSCISLSAV